MDLPFRIQTEPGEEPVISVDGAFGAPGLCLSHWPGNDTPAELRRDLSTGIALAFAELPAARRDELAAGCVAVANNHYDTDGLLALFAVLRPDLALPRAAPMLEAAACGDLFRFPSQRAFAVDRVLTRLADPQRSPIGAELRRLEEQGAGGAEGDRARWERATALALELLPALLNGDLEPHRDLWAADLERLQRDLARLAESTRDDLVHLDLTVWTSPRGQPFDPGRHALWGRGEADRVLVLGPGTGTTARLLLSTRSFFEPLRDATQPRPDLARLAGRLNGLESTDPADALAWRHQEQAGASPELWFGADGLQSFPEHAGDHLAPSALPPERIVAEVVDALRERWVFPEPDEEPA